MPSGIRRSISKHYKNFQAKTQAHRYQGKMACWFFAWEAFFWFRLPVLSIKSKVGTEDDSHKTAVKNTFIHFLIKKERHETNATHR
jgi:hypothetical protein